MDRDALQRLTAEQVALFESQRPRSFALCREAVKSMPLGAPTNVCALHPYPVAIDHGAGAHLTDVDGNTYVDLGAGYGTTVVGHAHPAVVKAVTSQAARGTHFGAVTEPVVELATHLCRRFSLDWVRFSASGTEATMDAIRIARAATGRTRIAKFDGAYHGSHPDGFVSINMPLDENAGTDTHPTSRPGDESLPPRVVEDVITMPFNNLETVEEALARQDVAALIVEPIMFNVGFIWPLDGFLQGLRDLCDAHDTLLIFDEVKTGATIAWGGAEEFFGVKPDLKCFAKAIGAGLPAGAFGGTDESLFALIEEQRMFHVGTLSGNPVSAAAGLAGLQDVLTPDAYSELARLNALLRAGLEHVIADHDLPAYVTTAGAKGCLVWAADELTSFRGYLREFDGDIAMLLWLYFVNHGVFLAPGHDEQWTLSVAHTDADIDKVVGVFTEFAAYIAA